VFRDASRRAVAAAELAWDAAARVTSESLASVCMREARRLGLLLLRIPLTAVPLLAAADAPRVPPFFDYDCALVSASRAAVADWNTVYEWVYNAVVNATDDNPSYQLSASLRPLISGPAAATAEDECPLGVLYLHILEFYEGFAQGSESEELLPTVNKVQSILRRFPVYAIALSRWPIFYALEHFAHLHEPQRELHCDDVHGVLDWHQLRSDSVYWADMKRRRQSSDELEALEHSLADMFFTVLKRQASQQQGQDECLFGFYFLVANQVVAAANRETQHLPPFNRILDTMVDVEPFMKIASSGWPILTVLVIFSDLNKGIWFFGGDRKYLRGYSDWNLRSDELSPLVSRDLEFLSPAWQKAVAADADELAHLLPAEEFARKVSAQIARREEESGPMRPIVRSLVDAAIGIAAATPRGVRRLTYVALLYGTSWAPILGRLAARLQQLAVGRPLFVVAIGEDAAQACAALASGRNGSRIDGRPPVPPRQVLCWTPGSPSQVHRFTAMNVLLHLGVDVIYIDMDTFMLRDPTPRILALAENWDALFASHADADCVNIGVFFLRAGARTAVWLSQFLAWYHDHPFEIDQRGLHVFLRLPSKQIQVAYPPEDLVELRAAILDDVNEIVIGDVGWHGELSRLLIFHWCHRPLWQKEEEINAAYDAADAAHAHGLSLAVGISVAYQSLYSGPWMRVLKLRAIFERYRKSRPPTREPCW